MNRNDEILKKIKTEEYIWIIYIIIIFLSFYANSNERKYYMYKDNSYKIVYRNLNIIIFLVALCIYIYFFNDSYKDVLNLKKSDSFDKIFFNKANLIASTLIFIAGIILLFIAIYDTELDTELAFS